MDIHSVAKHLLQRQEVLKAVRKGRLKTREMTKRLIDETLKETRKVRNMWRAF
jgi:hypothetical protein